ncbi:MAG: MarR family winged helix-turn-helix transcriptional regulator [Candidatus Methylomirabilales bacterium]
MRKARSTPATVAFGGSALESVIGETVSLFHRLRAVAEQVHLQGDLSAGKLGVLRGLDLSGPQTVPQMARARPVSRQYIQALVDQLAGEGYVESIENPGHKRSRLVRLTPQGKVFLDAAMRRQAKVFSRLKTGIPEKDLRTAASVLRAVRAFFESNQWKALLKTIK